MNLSKPGLVFVLAALAVWRISHLLVHEAGPFNLAARLRKAASANELGRALDCMSCTSLWLAAPIGVWLAPSAALVPLLWLALSAAAILLQRLTEAPLIIQPEPGDVP